MADDAVAEPVRATARAKLNLYLHVLGKRPDGYHALDSLVVFAELADDIVVARAPALTLATGGPFAGALGGDADNLVWRAATTLAQQAGIEPGAAIELTKNLPVAAGLGGGSADAAATLRALCRLWQLPERDTALAALAARLGADVPVCLQGRSCFMAGTGDQLAPAPGLPALPVVLANPGAALSTAEVFRAFRGPYGAPARFAAPVRTVPALAAILAERRNDLEAAATARAPAVADTLDLLRAQPGCLLARMSGSGATCFALFADDAAAAGAAAAIADQRPAWWVRATRCAASD